MTFIFQSTTREMQQTAHHPHDVSSLCCRRFLDESGPQEKGQMRSAAQFSSLPHLRSAALLSACHVISLQGQLKATCVTRTSVLLEPINILNFRKLCLNVFSNDRPQNQDSRLVNFVDSSMTLATSAHRSHQSHKTPSVNHKLPTGFSIVTVLQ